MTWQTCLRFVTRRRVPVLATAPDRAETSTRVRPMHDLTRLEVLQLLLCNFRTGTCLRLDSFVPRESTVGPRDDVLQQDQTRCRHASEPGYVGPRDDVLQQDQTRCRHASEPGYGMFARGRIREIRRRVR
jgi:hypothetical protein